MQWCRTFAPWRLGSGGVSDHHLCGVVHDGAFGGRRPSGGETVSWLTETVAAITLATAEGVSAAEGRQAMLTRPRGFRGVLKDLGDPPVRHVRLAVTADG